MNPRMKHMVVAAAVFGMLNVPVCRGAYVRIVPDHYASIQDAIDAAQDDDTVLIRDGEYTGSGNYDIRFMGKTITVRSENGPGNCIIDCLGQGRGFIFDGDETADARLDGVTITGARTTGTESGAGIICAHASPQIYNCVIKNCSSEASGSGIFLWRSTADIVNCIIESNTAELNGGGLMIYFNNPTIVNCIIRNNTAGVYGGGIHLFSTEDARIWNCLVAGNGSSDAGGGIMNSQSGAVLTNCTITGNSAGEPGGGIAVTDDCAPVILNSIIWDNVPDALAALSGAEPSVTYCNVAGGYPGTGNIDADPLFCSAAGFDVFLSHTEAGQSADSPCIDAGSDAAEALCIDFSGAVVCIDTLTTRTDGLTDTGTADMGCHSADRACTETGVRLDMPGHSFTAGDTFYLVNNVCNITGETLEGYVLFIALEIYGDLWFAPDWRPPHRAPCFYDMSFPPGLTEIIVIPEFIMPELPVSYWGLHFWSILSDPDMTQLLGDMDVWTFDMLASERISRAPIREMDPAVYAVR